MIYDNDNYRGVVNINFSSEEYNNQGTTSSFLEKDVVIVFKNNDTDILNFGRVVRSYSKKPKNIEVIQYIVSDQDKELDPLEYTRNYYISPDKTKRVVRNINISQYVCSINNSATIFTFSYINVNEYYYNLYYDLAFKLPYSRAQREYLLNLKCQVCQKATHEDQLALCSKCGNGYHTFCINEDTDENDWVCSKCDEEDLAYVNLLKKKREEFRSSTTTEAKRKRNKTEKGSLYFDQQNRKRKQK